MLLVAVIFGAFIVFSHNRYLNNYAYKPLEDLNHFATTILENTTGDEVIFVQKRYMVITPVLIYYTGRNVHPVGGLNDAEWFLHKHERQKGVIFFHGTDHLNYQKIVPGEMAKQ